MDDAKQKVNKEKADNGKEISLGYNYNTDNYQYLVSVFISNKIKFFVNNKFKKQIEQHRRFAFSIHVEFDIIL